MSEQTHIIDKNLHRTPKPYVDHEGVWYETYGALLVSLYEQLGKMRTCVFSANGETLKPYEVFEDIENALDMQMELLEHMMANGMTNTSHDIYNKAFFDEAKAHNGKIVFCWLTFKNVFGVPQLNAWKRDVDPSCVARELKQTLFLDIVETMDDAFELDPRVVFDCIDIVHDRAYGRADDSSGRVVVSASQVHLVRLLLWNMGVWNLTLNEKGYAKQLEEHVDTLIANAHHPFGEMLTVEDVVYGHASPLLVARLFVLCAHFVQLSPKERETYYSAFKSAYDAVVTKVRHPVFLAMLLKFRGHFLNRPHLHYLHKLWSIVDLGLWKQNVDLWNHLLEYALSVELMGNPTLYAHHNYFEELKRLNNDVMKTIGKMSKDEIANIRKTLKDTFVADTVQNPKPQTKAEYQKQAQRRRTLKRREGDMGSDVGDDEEDDEANP